jgi:hypothetical protein
MVRRILPVVAGLFWVGSAFAAGCANGVIE